MTLKLLAHSITGVGNVSSVQLTESYKGQVTQAIITGYSTTLDLGDPITFNIGFSGNTGKVFTGYVRSIESSLPSAEISVICEDELSKAIDFFIASDDPQDPFTRQNISTENLIRDILALADITSVSLNDPYNATWGVNGSEVTFNLVGAYDAVNQIVDILGLDIFANRNGTVVLQNRPPFDTGGEAVSFTWDSAADEILSISYTKSTDNLRNRVVVYGLEPIAATASASSPHLPSGFFKSAVIATPAITSQSQAQQAANINLALLNRLTETVNISVEGDWNVRPRLFATVTDSFTGVSGKWFIYQVQHNFSNDTGYTQDITLTR